MTCAAPLAAQSAPSRDVNWALCMVDVSEGTHVGMLLFEPFRIAADKESFDGIGKLFEAEAGVESVLPGYELFNETTLGYGSLEGCSVFPSEQLARGKFDATLNVEGYRFVKIVQWRPSDRWTLGRPAESAPDRPIGAS